MINVLVQFEFVLLFGGFWPLSAALAPASPPPKCRPQIRAKADTFHLAQLIVSSSPNCHRRSNCPGWRAAKRRPLSYGRRGLN